MLHVIRTDVLLHALGGFAQPPPNARDVLRARLTALQAQGLLYKEIAALLGTSENSVKNCAWRWKLPKRKRTHESPRPSPRRSSEPASLCRL